MAKSNMQHTGEKIIKKYTIRGINKPANRTPKQENKSARGTSAAKQK